MAFLRVKQVRGRPYAYLVENVWQAARGQSRQRVLSYLGRLDRVRPEHLPEEHRTSQVLRALEEKKAAESQRVRAAAKRHQARLTDVLLLGDPARARAVARAAIRELGEEEFLHRVISETMRDLGQRWSQGAVTVSQEHLATSILASFLAHLNGPLRSRTLTGPEVVVCVPHGEYHTLPLVLAERPLLEKGYRVLNIGPSAPAESTESFVRARMPFGVLISVTQPACLEAARGLARRLRRAFPRTRLVIGGQAVERSPLFAEIRGVDLWRGPLSEYLAGWPAANQTN
ncbi:MAG TPA: cobalamin-dependent protein [Thermoplasmata archaeon]|nr:cobalamin-dependent protein [Thermoplasmata archaeon]